MPSCSSRIDTPGLIAPGPGFTIPRLRVEHDGFTHHTCTTHAADFCANLIRGGVAQPQDWVATRSVAPFLQQTLCRFVGARIAVIDQEFSIHLNLSPTGDGWDHDNVRPDPKRVLLSFRVVDHVAWVNLTSTLELLEEEHELLPSFFYYSLNKAVSRWFRVFDIEDARWRWKDWIDMRDDEERERNAECRQDRESDELSMHCEEPKLPACLHSEMPSLPKPAMSLARSRKARKLIAAVEDLVQVGQLVPPQIAHPFSQEDRDELFPDADQDVPMLALAFGEHDAITEFLNEELEIAGQVDREPCPIFTMDGTNPDSIRSGFACADSALNTLFAASRVLSLIHNFER